MVKDLSNLNQILGLNFFIIERTQKKKLYTPFIFTFSY